MVKSMVTVGVSVSTQSPGGLFYYWTGRGTTEISVLPQPYIGRDRKKISLENHLGGVDDRGYTR